MNFFRSLAAILGFLALNPSTWGNCEDSLKSFWSKALADRIEMFNETFDNEDKIRFSTELLTALVHEDQILRLSRNNDNPKFVEVSGAISPTLKAILLSIANNQQAFVEALTIEDSILIYAKYLRGALQSTELSEVALNRVIQNIILIFSYQEQGPPLWHSLQNQAFLIFCDLFNRYKHFITPQVLLFLEESLDLEHAFFSIPPIRSVLIDETPASLRSLAGDFSIDALIMILNHPHYSTHAKTTYANLHNRGLYMTITGALVEIRNHKLLRKDGYYYHAGDHCYLNHGAKLKILKVTNSFKPAVHDPIYRVQVVTIQDNESNTHCPPGTIFSMPKEQFIIRTLGLDSPLQND